MSQNTKDASLRLSLLNRLVEILRKVSDGHAQIIGQNIQASSSQPLNLRIKEQKDPSKKQLLKYSAATVKSLKNLPRNLPAGKSKKKQKTSKSKALVPTTNFRYLDKIEIPAAKHDLVCDKCYRVIEEGLSYYKFLWLDAHGHQKSCRSHKICFDLNPEKELH